SGSGSGSGSDSEQERPHSASNASGSGSDRDQDDGDDDDDDGHDGGKPSNKELFGDDSEDEQGSDNQSEHSGNDNQSDASEHSEVEQHSGSEGHHEEEDDDEAHRWEILNITHITSQIQGAPPLDQGAPASGPGSPASGPGSPASGPGAPPLDQGAPPLDQGASPLDQEAPPLDQESPASGAGSHRSGRGSITPMSDHSDGEGSRTRRSSATQTKSEIHSDDEGREHKSVSAKGSDSEDDFVGQKKKKNSVRRLQQDDLFGEADDISSDSDNEKTANAWTAFGETHLYTTQLKVMTSSSVLMVMKVMMMLVQDNEEGMEGEQQEEEPQPETRIEVEIPKVSTDLGKRPLLRQTAQLPECGAEVCVPFDPQYYEDEFEDEEMLDEEGRTRLKLKVENTIRWRSRRDDEGNEVPREQRAYRQMVRRQVRGFRFCLEFRVQRFRLYQQPDMSLHLGNEVFDVYKAPLQGDHNHLFIRQGTGLQGQAVFKTKLTFRPHSTDSATHRKMTLSLADRCSKTQKIRILPMAWTRPRVSEERDDQEERARIYSSDSDEGSDDDKAQRLMKAKKLDSDEEGESSGKRKAEDNDDSSTKKAKKYVISDEEEGGRRGRLRKPPPLQVFLHLLPASLQITMSSANIIVQGDSCLTSSDNWSITIAKKKGLRADP
ncbi:hypothetical protein QTP70_015869, partial [Hemibagrus guttatus]